MFVTVNNLSSGATSYNWNFGNGITSILVNPSTAYNSFSTYSIMLLANSMYGCSDTSYKSITVNQPPSATFSIDVASGCAPLSVHFTNTALFAQSFHWDFGDGFNSAQANPDHEYDQQGSYSVNLITIGAGGCFASVTLQNAITVSPSPIADFSYLPDNDPAFAGNYFFTDASIDADSCLWDFGDGDTSTASNPEHRFDYPGIHTISLTAFRENGCTDTETKIIEIDFFKGLFIPNAFTPETGTHEVRVFKPIGTGLSQFTIQVYNTWGKLLWESSAINEKGEPTGEWDGNFNEAPCQQDAYVWKVWAVFKDETTWEGKNYGGEHLRTGTVTLIR